VKLTLLLFVNAAVSVAEESCRELGSACGEMAIADKVALSEINGLALRTTDQLSGTYQQLQEGMFSSMHHSFITPVICPWPEITCSGCQQCFIDAGSGASHLESVSALAKQINKITSDGYEQDAYQGAFPPSSACSTLQNVHFMMGLLQCKLIGLISFYWNVTDDNFDPGVIPEKVRLEMPAVAWYDDMRTPAAEILLAECRKQRDGLSGTQPPDADHALLESVEGANKGAFRNLLQNSQDMEFECLTFLNVMWTSKEALIGFQT
jgi:hypothetical protein